MLDMLRREQERYSISGTTFQMTSDMEKCGLDNVDCPVCHNSGTVVVKGESPLEIHSYPCQCMKKRLSLRSLKKAGMEDMARRYTMDSFVDDTPGRRTIKEKALRFIEQDSGWFFIGGQSGSGKTHICTAICSGLMEKFASIVFMPWRDDSTTLKMVMKDFDRYEDMMNRLKRAPVLYIDDFLKGGTTEADIKIAYELLNARYNNERLRTVISSEYGIGEIMQIDEALGGRIYERAKGFTVRAPKENWRLRQ